MKKNRHDSTGITRIMQDITVVNQKVASDMAYKHELNIKRCKYLQLRRVRTRIRDDTYHRETTDVTTTYDEVVEVI